VSPAIADLQTEAAHGRLQRLRHYGALTMVLGCAVLRDFRLDLRTAFEADALHHVWRRAALWYLGITLLMTVAALRAPAHWSWGVGTFLTTFEMEGAMPWHLLSTEQTTAAVTTSLLQGLVSALPFGMGAAAFYLCRQNKRRTIIAVAVVAAAATAIVGFSVRPIRTGADRALYETVAPQVANPEKAVGDTQHWKEWLQSRQREVDRRSAFWMDLQNAAMVVPFALFGVILARRRGWDVLGGALGIVVTLLFVMALCSIFPGPTFPLSQWTGVASMLVAGMLRLWLDGTAYRATLQM
jgi:hypothetical protein